MDFYLSKAVAKDELNRILADAFSKHTTDFLIIDGSLFDYFDENANCSIDYSEGDPRTLVELYSEKGDYPSKVCVDKLYDLNSGEYLDTAKNIAKIIKSKIIISNSEINPYHWTLIEPDGSHRNVFVDPEKLNNENAFVVVGDADY